MQYAYIDSVVCNILVKINEEVKEKVTDQKATETTNSLIKNTTTGLEKVYSMLEEAHNIVEAGKWPDFTNEVPAPPAPAPPPSSISDMPSWYMITWTTIKDGLSLLTQRNSKIAEVTPPIEVSGDELVKDLMQYFSPSHQHQIPALTTFPPFKASLK